ncbi:MAG: hypothetical protein Q9162_004614 [Coniocarpon cinnabarinum]
MSRIHQDNPIVEPKFPIGRHPSETMFRRILTTGRTLRVCVVGAGVAGLRAADVLNQHGARVTLMEARSRVGGRVGQAELGGHLVDTGANWLHGEAEGNPILDLARQTKSELHSWGERQAVFDDSGKPVPEDDVSETAENFWGIVSDAFQYSNEFSDSIPPERSLMDFVVERANQKYNHQPVTERDRKRRLLLQEAEAWGAFVGGPIQRQSLKFFWLEECIEGENPFLAGTYKKILDAIAKPALSLAELNLDTEVTKVTTKPEDESVEIQTANGERQLFDEVLVTLPLGCLKIQKDMFTPALPKRFASAVDSIGYGCLDKVIVNFPRAFWNRSPPSSSTLNGDAHLTSPNFRTQAAPVHTPSKSTFTRGEEQFPGFTHWMHPKYADKTNPAQWNQQGINLAALPSSTAHASLIFYIFGDCSRHIAELVKDKTRAEAKPALADFFQPYFARLPGYSESDKDCQPRDILATAWAGDQYAGFGSYSNFQVGLTEADRDIEVMRHGLPERRMWFAGEHTSPFVALGTVTGAYWAGEDAAKRIAGTYGLQKSTSMNGELTN